MTPAPRVFPWRAEKKRTSAEESARECRKNDSDFPNFCAKEGSVLIEVLIADNNIQLCAALTEFLN
ncbi:MAG: hypothetical protein FWJ61_09505, partial [Limnochordales bacterium]